MNLFGKQRKPTPVGYYPKWLEARGSQIVAAFKAGESIMNIARRHTTAGRYIIALLRSRNAYVVYHERPTVVAKRDEKERAKRPLIKHPSERFACLIAANDPPSPPLNPRKCVGPCQQPFTPEHRHNYICSRCSNLDVYAFNGEYATGAGR